MRDRSRRPGRTRDRGQTLAEFALALPVFFVVLFGLFDGGRLVYANSVVSQAAREGARLAATEAGWVGLTGGACVPVETDIDTAKPGCPRLSRRTWQRSRPMSSGRSTG